ncbi:MAG: hypothetical protein AB8H79_16090 [Myxococcota bacterium]
MRRWAWTALLIVGCAGDDPDVDALCDDAPVVTWDSFGQDFTRANCQPCHSSTSANRYGAPESVIFDTEDDVLGRAEQVLSNATGDAPTMPPRGGLEVDDQEKLKIWLECWAE